MLVSALVIGPTFLVSQTSKSNNIHSSAR